MPWKLNISLLSLGWQGTSHLGHLENMLQSAIAQAAARPPQRQSRPTKENPFLFLHLRKAGGSSVEQALYAADHTSYLPARNGNFADTYWPPIHYGLANKFAVLGGHFYKPMVDRWLTQRRHTSAFMFNRTSEEMDAPMCFVMLRATVPRVESCWNYRLLQESSPPLQGAKPFCENDAESLQRILPSVRSKYTCGCNNEAARVLSSFGMDELMLGSLTLDGRFSRTAANVVSEVLGRLSTCVIGILERCNDTMANVHKHLPWLAPHYHCSKRIANKGTTELGACQPTTNGESTRAREQIVLRQNAVDETAYAFANELLDLQLKV